MSEPIHPPRREGKARIERILSGIVLALLILGCLIILQPFLTAMLWAGILSFVTWPIYRRLLVAVEGKRNWAALLMTLAVAAVLVLPFVIAGFTMADDVRKLAGGLRHAIESGPPEPPAFLIKIPLIGSWADSYWRSFTKDGTSTLQAIRQAIEPATDFLLAGGLMLGRGVLQLTMSIFVLFFLYRDGAYVAERMQGGAIRLAGDRGERMLLLAGNTVRGVVYGILGTAIVQGIVAGIGFLIAGVPGAAMLALLTFLLSIVPMGPPLVWGPVAIWLFHRGSTLR